MADLSGHVESWPSTTKNVISPLLQRLSPPKWAGWWLTLRDSTHKVTWPFDHVISRDHVTDKIHYNPPPQCLWPPKWAGWRPTWRGSYSEFHMTLWSRDLAKLCGKLKALHLHNHSVCDHQTWQGGDLPWGAPTNSCGFWVAWSWEITRQIKNISYYHNAYGHQIWQVDWLTTIGSYL